MRLASYLILLSSISFSCQDTGPELHTPFLVKCWQHSYEEDSHLRIITFRPCDHKLPDAEVRNKIILREHDDAEYLVYSDDDANYLAPGTWQYSPENQHLIIYDVYGIPVRKYRVEDVQADLLRLWQLDDPGLIADPN